MNNENQTLAIDAGNTSIKVGHFINHNLKEVKRFSFEKLDALVEWKNSLSNFSVVVSSVLSPEHTSSLLSIFEKPTLVSSNTSVPFPIQYATKETLGVDRLCNAAYAYKKASSLYAVTIDIGTCIKFDIISKNDGYLGGSISPGIDLRYKSLNDYTGNLPLLSNKVRNSLVGNSTNSSIVSGILNGLNAEIEGLMEQYKAQFSDLTFFVTGGDASSFDIHSKNDIFADENLTLKGLYEIYIGNA